MAATKPMLSAAAARYWLQYVESERLRIREETMPALDRFISALLAQDPAEWKQWAKALAARIVDDRQEPAPVRLPLFREVLLPALVEGIQLKEPGCARWLAHFDNLLFHSRPADLPQALRTGVGLLREALRVDSSDQVARAKLVERNVSALEYSLHEVPAAVLAATVEECDELLQDLAELERDVQILGLTDVHAELIADCDYHFKAYRDYLMKGRPGGSSERYLADLQR